MFPSRSQGEEDQAQLDPEYLAEMRHNYPGIYPVADTVKKKKISAFTILLIVLLAGSIAGNIYLFLDKSALIEQYESAQEEYKEARDRARAYYAFYQAAKDELTAHNFDKVRSAAEDKIRDETVWAFNPKWGY